MMHTRSTKQAASNTTSYKMPGSGFLQVVVVCAVRTVRTYVRYHPTPQPWRLENTTAGCLLIRRFASSWCAPILLLIFDALLA